MVLPPVKMFDAWVPPAWAPAGYPGRSRRLWK
jgi:hypothetical protein